MFKYGIWVAGSVFASWVLYSLLGLQSFITGFGFKSLLALGAILIFYILKEIIVGDFMNLIFKLGIWVAGSVFASWVWYSLLGLQSFITGFGFDSLLALLAIITLYVLYNKIVGNELSNYI